MTLYQTVSIPYFSIHFFFVLICTKAYQGAVVVQHIKDHTIPYQSAIDTAQILSRFEPFMHINNVKQGIKKLKEKFISISNKTRLKSTVHPRRNEDREKKGRGQRELIVPDEFARHQS